MTYCSLSPVQTAGPAGRLRTQRRRAAAFSAPVSFGLRDRAEGHRGATRVSRASDDITPSPIVRPAAARQRTPQLREVRHCVIGANLSKPVFTALDTPHWWAY